MLSWNRQNTLKGTLPSTSGIYTFYDKNRKLLYVGHAKQLRHRVQSYREQDDFNTHPTKAVLRPQIKYFQYKTLPLKKAEATEKKIKVRAKYNYL